MKHASARIAQQPRPVRSLQFTHRTPRLPAARCGCRLDGVDPQPGGDVAQRLQRLLVGFVVVLHPAEESVQRRVKRPRVCCPEKEGDSGAAADDVRG